MLQINAKQSAIIQAGQDRLVDHLKSKKVVLRDTPAIVKYRAEKAARAAAAGR